MNNISSMSYNQNVQFAGKVDKKSAKLAAKLGGDILQNLENVAKGTSKSTVIKLNEMGSNYAVSAFNTKIGESIGMVIPKESLSDMIKNIDPKTVDETLVDKGIKYIKSIASASSMNTTEKRMLRNEAKDLLSVQREIGLKKPFWSETKKLMAEADIRADQERIEFDRQYAAWKEELLQKRIAK